MAAQLPDPNDALTPALVERIQRGEPVRAKWLRLAEHVRGLELRPNAPRGTSMDAANNTVVQEVIGIVREHFPPMQEWTITERPIRDETGATIEMVTSLDQAWPYAQKSLRFATTPTGVEMCLTMEFVSGLHGATYQGLRDAMQCTVEAYFSRSGHAWSAEVGLTEFDQNARTRSTPFTYSINTQEREIPEHPDADNSGLLRDAAAVWEPAKAEPHKPKKKRRGLTL